MTEKVTDSEAKNQILFIFHFINSKISPLFSSNITLKQRLNTSFPLSVNLKTIIFCKLMAVPSLIPPIQRIPPAYQNQRQCHLQVQYIYIPREQQKCATCILKYNVNVRTGNLGSLFITTAIISTEILEHT